MLLNSFIYNSKYLNFYREKKMENFTDFDGLLDGVRKITPKCDHCGCALDEQNTSLYDNKVCVFCISAEIGEQLISH